MKAPLPSAFRLIVLVSLAVFAPYGIAAAQSVDCEGTLASWRMTHPEYAKTCECRQSNALPVCSGGQSTGSSGKKSTKRNTENEIKMMVIENILTNVFAPQNNTAKQEELKRKQQEELARKQREEEERRRQQEIFERNKDELLNAFKSGNQGTGLRLKGGGEELLDLKQASDASPAGAGGRESARRGRIATAP